MKRRRFRVVMEVEADRRAQVSACVEPVHVSASIQGARVLRTDVHVIRAVDHELPIGIARIHQKRGARYRAWVCLGKNGLKRWSRSVETVREALALRETMLNQPPTGIMKRQRKDGTWAFKAWIPGGLRGMRVWSPNTYDSLAEALKVQSRMRKEAAHA